MIRKFAIVAIATAAITGSQLGSASAANSAPPSFLGGAYGVAALDPAGKTIYVGSANGGVWKITDGGTSFMAFDSLTPEPQALQVPAIQKPLCSGKYC